MGEQGEKDDCVGACGRPIKSEADQPTHSPDHPSAAPNSDLVRPDHQSSHSSLLAMETVRRDLHSTTATVSSLLTRYSKLAAQASTSYSSSGTLAEDITRRKDELETELNGSLEVVRA